MSTFAIGDIHGAHIALQQCLERSGFNKKKDLLITHGDIVDGWPYVFECVEILLTIRDRIDLMGNHDKWFLDWIQKLAHPVNWSHGGKGTYDSYVLNCDIEGWGEQLDIPESHIKFFRNQHLYYKDEKDRLFVHAGFDRNSTLSDLKHRHPSDFYWNRQLFNDAMLVRAGKLPPLIYSEDFSEIFVGHNCTLKWSEDDEYSESGLILVKQGRRYDTPLHADKIWNLDTGAGWFGKLTIMNIDTHEYWQSDNVKEIYAGEANARG